MANLNTNGDPGAKIEYISKKWKITANNETIAELGDASKVYTSLSCSGKLEAGDALAVAGAVTVGGAATIGGTLIITGVTTIPTIGGASTFTGNTTMTGTLNVVSNLAVTGTLKVNSDIDAAGGFAQSFLFFNQNLLQGTKVRMTASVMSSSNLYGPSVFMEIPMVRAGSVRGISINTMDSSTHLVKSASLTASVMVNGANVACSVVFSTGSNGYTTIGKDVATFLAGQRIGVSLSASTSYLCEPDITSASFIATVLVEM